MNEYKLIQKIGEGTFSDVFKALSLRDNNYVAVKCMKKKFPNYQNVTQLEEIKVLKTLSPHQNIVELQKILYDEPTGQLALVFQLMEQNLYEAIIQNNNKQKRTPQKIRNHMYKVLKALHLMHTKGYIHRDIKPENILLSGDQTKLADFGTAKGKVNSWPYTQYIATRWYRPPQCLLTSGYYSQQMDIWGFGCVLFQAITRYPLFNGKNEMDQINKINKIIGSPNQQIIQKFLPYATHMKPKDWQFQPHKGISFSRLLPHSSPQLIDFLSKVIVYDPAKRLTTAEALKHPYFTQIASPTTDKKLSSGIHTPLKRKITKQNLLSKDKKPTEPDSALPPINNNIIKFQMKTGILNHTIGTKLKKPLWNKFKIAQKY